MIVSWNGVSGATKHYIWRSTDDSWGDNDDYQIEVLAPAVVYTDTCTSTATSTFPTSNTTGGTMLISGNILPATTTATSSSWSLGAASAVWAHLYVVTTHVGDIIFANQFVLTEAMSTSSPQALIFQNASSSPILTIDENGKLTVNKLVAKEIETEKITIKDSEVSKTGITIYDRATGEPNCIYIENGQMQTAAGACSATSTESNGTSTASGGSDIATSTSETATSTEPTCTSNWSCSDWQPPLETQSCGQTFAQTRTCADLNNCGAEEGKPIESQETTGTLCSASNAIGTCQSASCSFTCQEGYSNCDNDMTNGCEYASSTCPTL